jgi:60 kDa SS-A/Ro ribonucleoprotein
MHNKNLFSTRDATVPVTDHVNLAGGRAYRLDAENALAKAAVTGTFSETFYADAEMQLASALELADACEPEFVAKVAVFARERGLMKDMPAFLAAWLHARGENELLQTVFSRVIDNGRMLRTFVQMVRSGRLGRRSFGSATKRLIRDWLCGRHPAQLLNDSVGRDPSLADVIRMVHPNAADREREALHGYLLGRDFDAEALPEVLKAYEAWKADPEGQEAPDVPFQMLTFRDDLPQGVWTSIARNAKWQMTRMNLNTFARHGVFEDREMTDRIARRLGDAKEVRRARVFPYQLLVAYANATDEVPLRVREALQEALEVATENAPELGRVAVAVDTSGSMRAPVTGYRRGASSAVRCVDVAALVASVVMRRNPEARILPFDTRVHRARLNPRDSVLTNAARLARYGGGGTDCSAAMARLNRERRQYDLVVYVSDYESWSDYVWGRARHRRGTGLGTEWRKYKETVNPKAKLVLIDLQPYRSVQAGVGGDVLLVGGFSDAVFDVIRGFLVAEENDWIAAVLKTEL